MLTAGGFNLSNNSKFTIFLDTQYWPLKAFKVGWPAYGEHVNSNYFQRLGYKNIRTQKQMMQNRAKIWGTNGH